MTETWFRQNCWSDLGSRALDLMKAVDVFTQSAGINASFKVLQLTVLQC